MLISLGALPNPAPTLLEDLVSRTGSPDMHSLSPYKGMANVLFQQFPPNGNNLDRIVDLLRQQPDYNADKQKPVAGTWIKDRVPPTTYLRRLEDIDETWVRKYLENVLVGVKKNKSGGIREYYSDHKEAYTLTDLEGNAVEESELLLEHQPQAPMAIAEAIAKLPYLLKRLYDKSLEMRVSAMSLIIAYERAKLEAKNLPKPKDILLEGVYKMDAEGHLGTQFLESANSGKVFPPACDWIRGFNKDPYFADMVELLQVCEVLGIDIKQEDPRDFQAEDIAKLKVTYISRNRDYLSGARQRNLSVMNSLRSVKVSDYQLGTNPAISIRMQTENMAQAVLDCLDPTLKKCLEHPLPTAEINRFFNLYAAFAPDFRVTWEQHLRMATGKAPDNCKNRDRRVTPLLLDFYTRDGFLCARTSPTRLETFRVGKFVDATKVSGTIAIAHTAGYLFLLSDDCRIFYLDMSTLADYMEDAMHGNFANKYVGNRKYGWWNCCYA